MVGPTLTTAGLLGYVKGSLRILHIQTEELGVIFFMANIKLLT